MAGPEVSIARAPSELSRILSDREAGEVIVRREIHTAQGRGILTARHQVHLRDELTRPTSDDAGELGVISEGMLTILTQTQGKPLKRSVLGRAVGLTVNPDGAKDPTAWRLRELLRRRFSRSLLPRLGEEQRYNEKKTTKGTQKGVHGDAASKAPAPTVATPEAYFFRFSRSSEPGRIYLLSLPSGLMRRSLSWRFLAARS